jgi:glycosyltransferase involved in cell wall biosynthesis
LKIAILAPITWRTPPKNYGPWEQVASVLTEGLVKKGMDVTLFATGDSLTEGRLASVCPRPIGEYPADAKVWESLHISQLMERAPEFDIIHNHFDFLPLTYSRLIGTPVITTIHGFSSEEIVPVYKKYNDNCWYVSISDSDRHAGLRYLGTVYNGIDERLFQLGGGGGDGGGGGNYLLYFGRIHPHKGAHEAIRIAIRTGTKLILCGLIQDAAYFDEKVAPLVDGSSIVYKGNVGPEERNQLLGNARALLHPISFEEPFGLSVVEAMMCGTPVIAFERGSMKELIVDGQTGFLVNTIDEAVDAAGNIGAISRMECRRHALAHFSGSIMAERYIELYERILRG